jgi:ATP-dependent DNA helicase PIF1
MLLRNLDTDVGHCNGTRLVVTELGEHTIKAKVITGRAAGDLVFIPRIDLITESGLPFQLKRRQFPIKVAFAMTIDKSQWQTLDRVGTYLPNPVFSHGQLCMSLFREYGAQLTSKYLLKILNIRESYYLAVIASCPFC